MNERFLNLITCILPPSVRTYLGSKRVDYRWKYGGAIRIQKYYRKHPTEDNEILDILPNLPKYKDNPMIPYEWAKIPCQIPVDVFLDSGINLKYVMMDGKRLYYPSEWDDQRIKFTYYWVRFIEQHPSSPHCYLSPSFNACSDDIAVDFGAAEANWGLSIIDTVKRLYVFEPEDIWIEPLKATFSKWPEKVIIVKKYISDFVEDNTTSIDDYFKDKEHPTLLKFDIEGFEKHALTGGKKIFSENSGIKAVVCTYHNAEDDEELSKIMKSYGFTISYSEGYMLPIWNLKPPYFRRGVIRCTKS